MAKMGRPRLPKGAKKGTTVTLRLTEIERRAAELAAKRGGVPLSEWARQVIVAASA